MLPVSYAFVGGKSTMYCVGMCIGRLGARRWLEGKELKVVCNTFCILCSLLCGDHSEGHRSGPHQLLWEVLEYVS